MCIIYVMEYYTTIETKDLNCILVWMNIKEKKDTKEYICKNYINRVNESILLEGRIVVTFGVGSDWKGAGRAFLRSQYWSVHLKPS